MISTKVIWWGIHNCYGQGITDMIRREEYCLGAGVRRFLLSKVSVKPCYPA